MTRTEITAEVQEGLDRFDASTKTQIENWINRVVKDVEKLYPFKYTRKPQTFTIAADTAEYTLPTTLIHHLPFSLSVQDAADSDVYYQTFNLETSIYDYWVSDKNKPGAYPLYFVQRGGSNGLVIRFHPVPDQALTGRIEGHFYTGAWTIGSGGDASTNWLSDDYPDVIIEGTLALGFKRFEEFENAQVAREMYNAHLNGSPTQGIHGLLPSERRRAFRNQSQMPRVKTVDDFPFSTGTKLRRFQI